MADTRIEWAEKVWNPVTGCTWISPGCDHCYAKRMAQRLAGRHGYPARDPFAVTVHEDRLHDPLRWTKPKRVFVCSMGDLFHHDVRVESGIYHRIFDVIGKCQQHVFMILTKRPVRMWRVIQSLGGKLPDNVWAGVTVEDQRAAASRIGVLMEIPAKVRFLSLEPLIDDVELYLDEQSNWIAGKVDWIIVGGETGPSPRLMEFIWLESVVRQARNANVPLFVKQISGRNHNTRHYEMPEWAMVRMFPGEHWPNDAGGRR